MPSVLVIDDSEGCRAYLTTLLGRAGYQVHALPDGRGVEIVLALVPIDAIITDLFMPGADGLETIRRVKQVAPDVPVIGITGAAWRADDCYIHAMTVLGAAAVLLKPLDGEAVLLAVKQGIAERMAAREQHETPSEGSPSSSPAGTAG